MPEARAVVVVSGAPELRCVPPEFWARLCAYIREQKTGSVSWNFNRGRLESFEAREHLRVERQIERYTG